MNRWREIGELTRVRVLLFWREPEAVFWVIVFPVILAVVLGFAFAEGEVEASRVGVLAEEGSEDLVSRLESFDGLEVQVFHDEAEARRKLRKGAIDALMRPGATPEIRYDPARPEGTIVSLRIREALRPPEERSAAALEEITEAERGSRYIDFLFPGLLGMNIMGTGIWGIGFAVVDTRQKKLLKRMLVTPMRRSSFLVSFITSRLVFLVGEAAVLLLFGLFVLDVPLAGSLFAFTVLCLLGTLSFAGLGLLVASRAKTIEGVSGLMNFIMMPMWLCSGVFFSYERFPDFLHPVFRAIPLTALNDGLRAVMLDGAGLAALWLELLITAAWGVVTFVVALRIFRWS